MMVEDINDGIVYNSSNSYYPEIIEIIDEFDEEGVNDGIE